MEGCDAFVDMDAVGSGCDIGRVRSINTFFVCLVSVGIALRTDRAAVCNGLRRFEAATRGLSGFLRECVFGRSRRIVVDLFDGPGNARGGGKGSSERTSLGWGPFFVTLVRACLQGGGLSFRHRDRR